MNPLDAIVETWHPALGQRVRVTAGIAECQHRHDECDVVGTRAFGPDYKGHPTEFLGQIGTVQPTHAEAADPRTHPYAVEFDSAVWLTINPLQVHQVFGAHFAACELEPA